MNPVDNNTNINPGAGSDSFGPAPAGGAGGPSGFSNDTLNIAKDNSPSTAKPEGESSAVAGTESTPAMTMDTPETPFVPASPVPGSIGSATSGPAAGSTNLAAAVAPSGADGSAAFVPVNDANPTMPPVGNNDLLAQAANETPAASPAFNPFAPTSASNTAAGSKTAPSSASAIPGAVNAGATAPNQNAAMPSPFQARMDDLAAKTAKAKGGSSNILTIIFAGVGAIAIIAAIVFCVLWRQAVDNPPIRYVPSPSADSGSANANSVATCTRMYGAGEVAGMENLINEEATLTLNFTNDEWQSSNLYAVYNFVDAGAAEVANAGIFAAMTSSLSLNSNSGEAIVSASSQVLDNRVEYKEDINIALMNGEMANGRDIPRTEDGSIQKNRADVQAYYANQGWTCE